MNQNPDDSQSQPLPPPVAVPAQGMWIPPQPLDLQLVARRQRWLNWMALVLIGTNFGMIFALPLLRRTFFLDIFSYCTIGSWIVIVVNVILMMVALKKPVALMVLIGILMFAPCINLLVLLVVNQWATRTLRMAGVSVGFMGAKDEFARLAMNPWLCRACGYNLYGNVSGRCPECGRELIR